MVEGNTPLVETVEIVVHQGREWEYDDGGGIFKQGWKDCDKGFSKTHGEECEDVCFMTEGSFDADFLFLARERNVLDVRKKHLHLSHHFLLGELPSRPCLYRCVHEYLSI